MDVLEEETSKHMLSRRDSGAIYLKPVTCGNFLVNFAKFPIDNRLETKLDTVVNQPDSQCTGFRALGVRGSSREG